MKKVGSNLQAQLQTKTIEKNTIGEGTQKWTTVQTLKGWLDYMAGSADYINYNAKTEETTHVFICDYTPITYTEEQARLLINGKPYDIEKIDDPMELHYHLEIYLKYVGD